MEIERMLGLFAITLVFSVFFVCWAYQAGFEKGKKSHLMKEFEKWRKEKGKEK